MAKVTKTISVCTCDRCGKEGDTGETVGRNTWGELNVSWSGHTGGRTLDGALGGNSFKGEAWLCLDCTEAFLKFMRNGD